MYRVSRIQDESGQTMAEYAVVVGVMITITILLAFSGLAGAIANSITAMVNRIPW